MQNFCEGLAPLEDGRGDVAECVPGEEGGRGRGSSDTLSANSRLLFRIIKTAPPPRRFFFPQM